MFWFSLILALPFGSVTSRGLYTSNLYALAHAPSAWGLEFLWDVSHAEEDQALAFQGNALWAWADTASETVVQPWLGYRAPLGSQGRYEAYGALSLARGTWAYTNHWELGLSGDWPLRSGLRITAGAMYRQYQEPEIPGFWQVGLETEVPTPNHNLSLAVDRRGYTPLGLGPGREGFDGATVFRVGGALEALWSPDPWSLWGLRLDFLRVFGDSVPEIATSPILDPDLLEVSHTLGIIPWGQVDLPWKSQIRVGGSVRLRWYPWTWDSLATGEQIRRWEREFSGRIAWERHLWGATTVLVEGQVLRVLSTNADRSFTEVRWSLSLRHYF